jgi:cytochrome P450
MLLDTALQYLPRVLWTLLYAVPILVSSTSPLPFPIHSHLTALQSALGLLLTALYNLLLHPLRRYPGPLLSRALPFAHAQRIRSGRGPVDVHHLHERYGPVVRVGPNHLTYTDVRAWKDIFGHRAGEHLKLQENPKSQMFYRDQIIDRSETDAPNIIDADREEHSRLRRALAGGFSEKAMREQEPVIAGYVDLLVEGIRRRSEKGEELNMSKWYNWVTFDVVGDLVFAESFGCLEGERGHPFVNLVTGIGSQAAMFTAMKYAGLGKVPGFKWALNKVVKLYAKDLFLEMQRVMYAKVQHRLQVKEERSDLFEGLVSKREEWVSNNTWAVLGLRFCILDTDTCN